MLESNVSETNKRLGTENAWKWFETDWGSLVTANRPHEHLRVWVSADYSQILAHRELWAAIGPNSYSREPVL